MTKSGEFLYNDKTPAITIESTQNKKDNHTSEYLNNFILCCLYLAKSDSSNSLFNNNSILADIKNEPNECDSKLGFLWFLYNKALESDDMDVIVSSLQIISKLKDIDEKIQIAIVNPDFVITS